MTHTTRTHWILADLLHKHGVKVPALVQASGLSKNTVYDIVNGKSRAVTLETLDSLLSGLEAITGTPVSLSDVLAREPEADPYAHLFKDAKPYDPTQYESTPWTEEELAADERYWAEQREEKLARLSQPDKRYEQWLEIMGEDEQASTQ